MTALVAVALIWGGALSASSAALEGVAAVQQVALRFAVAAVTLAATLPGTRRNITRSTLIRGLGLGTLLAAGFLLQTCALETTPVVASAFLTGTVVVFAPVIAVLWGGEGLSGHAVTGVLLATTGLALITLRGVGIGVGELMTLAAALAWAVHLVALQRWGRPGEALPLALIQVASVAALAWALAALQGCALSLPRSVAHAGLVAGLGAIGTAAALVLLTWAQGRVDATTAAVVLTLEPVFGAACAWAVLGETLTPTVALGAIAVVTATLLTVWSVPRHGRRPSAAATAGRQAAGLPGEPWPSRSATASTTPGASTGSHPITDESGPAACRCLDPGHVAAGDADRDRGCHPSLLRLSMQVNGRFRWCPR